MESLVYVSKHVIEYNNIVDENYTTAGVVIGLSVVTVKRSPSFSMKLS